MTVIIILLGRGDTESHFVSPYCLLVCLDLTEIGIGLPCNIKTSSHSLCCHINRTSLKYCYKVHRDQVGCTRSSILCGAQFLQVVLGLHLNIIHFSTVPPSKQYLTYVGEFYCGQRTKNKCSKYRISKTIDLKNHLTICLQEYGTNYYFKYV